MKPGNCPYVIFSIGIGALLLIIGCSNRESTTEPGPQTQTASPVVGQKVESQSQTQVGAGGLSVLISPDNPGAGEVLRARVTGATGAKIDYFWTIDGLPVEGSLGTKLEPGVFHRGSRVEVRVEFEGKSASSTTLVVNSPPKILKMPYEPSTVFHGVDLSAKPQAEDVDGDEITFRYTWYINGEEVAGNDAPTLAGDRFRRGDRISISVLPNDGQVDGELFSSGEILIPNGPPSFVSTPPVTFKGALFSYQAKAVDPDEDRVSYALEQAPEGMTLDGASGLVKWSYNAADAGEHRIRITARDAEDAWVSQDFVLNIKAPGGPE